MTDEILKAAAARCFVHNYHPQYVHITRIIRIKKKKNLFIAELEIVNYGGAKETSIYGFRYETKGKGFIFANRLFKVCGKEVNEDGHSETE